MEPQTGLTSVDLFERGLIHGGARWMADLTEFFRDYRIDDTTFALYATGKTRSSGFLLSRFVAWTILPNYNVGLFCLDEAVTPLSVERLRKRIDLVDRKTGEDGFHWVWLVILSDRRIAPEILSFVTRYDKKEVGLAVASTSTGQIVLSNNQVGKAIRKQLGLVKALEGRNTRTN